VSIKVLINRKEAFNEVVSLRRKEQVTPFNGRVVISIKSEDRLINTLKGHDNFKAKSLTKAGKKVML